MSGNHLLLHFLGTWAFFAVRIVAREAIIGGEIAPLFPFRYMVSLLEDDFGHLCGGAIVGEQHILTAAHCVVNPNNQFKTKDIFALVGTSSLMAFTKPAINLKVTKMYVPKTYHAGDVDAIADIAVLKLEKPLELPIHENLLQAKLPVNKKEEYVGEKAMIAGWGWNLIDSYNYPLAGRRTDPLLRFAKAKVLSNHHCQQEHPAIEIYVDHLCARIEQHENKVRGVCRGDDGSPLVHNGLIIGVLSRFPYNCTERTQSAIYTRVSHYLKFIRNAKEDKVTYYMRTNEENPQ